MPAGSRGTVLDHENTLSLRPVHSRSPLTARSIGSMPATAFTMTATVSTVTATMATRLAFTFSQWTSPVARGDDRPTVYCRSLLTALGHGQPPQPTGRKVRDMISEGPSLEAQQRERSAVTGNHRQPNRRLCRAAMRQSIVERHENLSCF